MQYYEFARSPRLISSIPKHEVEIDAAPASPQKPEINWLTVFMPTIVMIIILIVMSQVAMSSGGNSSYMLFLMVPMMLVGVITSIINHSNQVKKFKAQDTNRKKKYNEYLGLKRNELIECGRVQKEILTQINPSVSECKNIVMERKRRLWERTGKDLDFMSVRVGTGTLPLLVKIKTPKLGFTLDEDPFIQEPHQIEEACKDVKDVPIVCDLKHYPSCGIIGGYSESSNLARCMVVNAITHHGYDDLKIVSVFRQERYSDWAWLRWLPHTLDESGEQRFLACGKREADKLFDKLLPILKARQEISSHGEETQVLPYYLFLIEDVSVIETHAISKLIMQNNPDMGCGYIILSENMSGVPHDTLQIINIHNDSAQLYAKKKEPEVRKFVSEKVSIKSCDSMARSLAAVRLVAAFDSNSKLPKTVTFLEGYGVNKPVELDLREFWENARAEKTMEVPIGVSSNGGLFYFDINEKKHGPHGIVAGTTGSGKSEMIQSWILSMAIQFSPDDVSFVLIDFKGTGLILPFQSLPHLAGTISDLDSNIGRNLIALRAELQRRKALFDQSGTNNIAGYLKLYREGKVTEPLSYLFVIIDEYAEFKANYPEFTAEVNSLFRTGRALGVHIILLTQNPAGVISGESESNVQFRWCLKVAGVAASREILGGHSEAARITVPGRAYVRVGTDDVFEQIQSLWSGAPYFAEERRKNVAVNLVGLSGDRTSLYKETSKKFQRGQEINAIVDYIRDYTSRHNINKARKVWTEQLPNTIFIDSKCKWDEQSEELTAYVGMLDDPWEQRQYPFRLPISESGHVVLFGAPQSGKTTFLQTCVMSMCNEYTPDRLNMYIMDFGSWSMKAFERFPHVGAVAYSNEDAVVLKIAQLVEGILDERKIKFAQEGVGSIQSYNRTDNENIPYVVLLIDNFTPILQVFPQLEDFFTKLTREGGSYGVYMITSCSNNNGLGYRMQQNIKTKVTLQLTDSADYSGIVGKTDGLYPMNTVGRGLYKSDRVMEFQTAMPAESTDESTRIRIIREIGEKYANEWNGEAPEGPKVMPNKVYFRDYVSEDGLILGLNIEDVAPVSVSNNDSYLMLVSTMSDNDREKIINLLSSQIVEKKDELVLVSNSISASKYSSENVNVIDNVSSFDDFILHLADILQQRKDAVDNGIKIDMHQIFVVIDELKRNIDEMSQETLNRLNAFAQIGQGLNVMIIAVENASEINPLKGYIPFVNKMAKVKMLLMGGCIANHELAEASVDIQQKRVQIKENEAVFIRDNETIRIKLVE